MSKQTEHLNDIIINKLSQEVGALRVHLIKAQTYNELLVQEVTELREALEKAESGEGVESVEGEIVEE